LNEKARDEMVNFYTSDGSSTNLDVHKKKRSASRKKTVVEVKITNEQVLKKIQDTESEISQVNEKVDQIMISIEELIKIHENS
jgi:TolA-binding protein